MYRILAPMDAASPPNSNGSTAPAEGRGQAFRSIRIQNFRAIEDVTLPLGPFQVLIGENNSGKTSLLDAIVLAGRLAASEASGAFSGTFDFGRNVRAGASPERMGWEIHLQAELQWSLWWGRTPTTHVGTIEERLIDRRALPRAVEDIVDPKTHFHQLFGDRKAAEGSDETIHPARERLIRALRPDEVESRCPQGFRPFRKDVLDKIVPVVRTSRLTPSAS